MKILLLMVLLMIPVAYAIPECSRFNSQTSIPCNIISSYSPTNCYVNGTVLNSSSIAPVQNLTWKNYTQGCAALFNITLAGTYTYNGIETGIITVEGDNNMIIALLLIPIAMMFMFIYWSTTLNEEQEPLKWFFRLLALLMVFILYGGATIAISLNPAYNAFLSLFDIGLYGIIFYAVIAIFLIYFIFKIFISFKQKKKDDFEKGVLR